MDPSRESIKVEQKNTTTKASDVKPASEVKKQIDVEEIEKKVESQESKTKGLQQASDLHTHV